MTNVNRSNDAAGDQGDFFNASDPLPQTAMRFGHRFHEEDMS